MTDRHLRCSICSHIPEKSNTFYVGGERQGDGSGDIPEIANKLEIVGAPFFKDDMVSSRTILKKCPECGTYYEWDYEYEFLVPQSEDDVTLTRISDERGKAWEAEVYATIRKSEARFREQAEDALQVLTDESTHQELAKALQVFSYASSVQGHDISFALPRLVEMLSHYSLLLNAMRVLFFTPSADGAQARLILDAISNSDKVAAFALDIENLKAACEETLAGEK